MKDAQILANYFVENKTKMSWGHSKRDGCRKSGNKMDKIKSDNKMDTQKSDCKMTKRKKNKEINNSNTTVKTKY